MRALNVDATQSGRVRKKQKTQHHDQEQDIKVSEDYERDDLQQRDASEDENEDDQNGVDHSDDENGMK